MSENGSGLVRQGRVWLFTEDNINTDLIMPSEAFRKSVDEQLKMVFSVNRPGWADEVRDGDILVGSKNFGTGSSRPGAQLFKLLGIGALVAETINGLFYRNCVNYALPALECKGITDFVEEGDEVRVDVRAGTVENLTRGASIEGEKMPDFLAEIVASGGVLERLKKEGYVK